LSAKAEAKAEAKAKAKAKGSPCQLDRSFCFVVPRVGANKIKGPSQEETKGS